MVTAGIHLPQEARLYVEDLLGTKPDFVVVWKVSKEFFLLLYFSPFSPPCPVPFRITAKDP